MSAAWCSIRGEAWESARRRGEELSSLSNPCVCVTLGAMKPECYTGPYKWAVDRLITEFGESAVRVGWIYDYERRQKVAVSSDGWKEYIFIQHLKSPDGSYDMNSTPSDLDAFIERIRPAFLTDEPSGSHRACAHCEGRFLVEVVRAHERLCDMKPASDAMEML
jgi:hypothetical protein